MTDPVTLSVAAIASSVAVVVAFLSMPSPPDLDAERWFKQMLTILLRGEVDHAGGTAEQWAERVRGSVLWHPAGRRPERRLLGLPVGAKAIPGELELADRLTALPDRAARWHALYEDPAAQRALLADPLELGPDYDPGAWLGSVGWDDLADWGGGHSTVFPEALARLGITWVLVGGAGRGPDVLGELEKRLPDVARVDGRTLALDVLEKTLRAMPDRPEYRFVFVGEGEGIQTVLRALHVNGALRDRTEAVVSVHGVLSVDEDGPLPIEEVDEWAKKHFDHHSFDLEKAGVIPFLSMQWLDPAHEPPGAYGLRVEQARFVTPPQQKMTAEAIEAVDLGVVHVSTPAALVAQGLMAVVSCWVCSQRY